MKHQLYLIPFALLLFYSCIQKAGNETEKIASATDPQIRTTQEAKKHEIIQPEGRTLEKRILAPPYFERIKAESNSFADYLRNLPLKEHNANVLFYDGYVKENNNVYDAVVDLPIGNKNLHQCADAIMRLRAEYLWEQKRYNDIHFNFTNGFRVDYAPWMQGNRISVRGNKVSWVSSTNPSNTYQDFWKYIEIIFSYAGTLSLSKELKPVSIDNMEVGDIFIQGGSPGHAVLVVDMAQHKETGEKVFLLAQSYMPAQETQILTNRNNSEISPWYSLNEINTDLYTPEWSFTSNDLKRF